jgi:GNAT superfamily N-acetyltransferase
VTRKSAGGIRVRPAGASDVPTLGDMAREFQDYINSLCQPGDAPEPAALTVEALRRDGFGDDPWFSVLVAERAGVPVGYLLYHFGYWSDRAARALMVANLFVREAARGQGAGKALMREATQILRRRGGDLIVWTVWDRNPEAMAFYQNLGATTHSEELIMLWPDVAWPPD